MKQILDQMQDYTPATATSKDLYFIAGQIVVKYQTINTIKQNKPAIVETFGNYKDILSRCKELIKAGWNSKKQSVLAGINYNSVLAEAWKLARQDSHFAALCADAESNGLFVTADDFVSRFYPHINETGQPLTRHAYTNGLYMWTEWTVRPQDRFTDAFALQAIKASIRFCYDNMKKSATAEKAKQNIHITDTPFDIKWLDTECTKEINLNTATEQITTDKDNGAVVTLREWNKDHKSTK